MRHIEEAAFEKEKNSPIPTKIKIFRRDESQTTRILKNGEIESGIHFIRSRQIQSPLYDDLNRITQSFISKLAHEILHYKTNRSKDDAKQILKEINERYLNGVEKRYIENLPPAF